MGTPLAVGAAAAARELAAAGTAPRRVVLVTGDGSLGFYPAELHAAALTGLPLVVVVCNDGAWGTEYHGQVKAIGRGVNTRLGQLPYERLGEAFGGTGLRVERAAELGPALDAAFASARPCVVNVLVDPQAGAAIKSDPRAAMILFDDLASSARAQRHQGEDIG
jgi:acetolactate synthase-1/2/3 large subunit